MITPGTIGDHSSFWSKVTSLYGLFLTLCYFLEECQMMSSQITVACDGQSVWDRLRSLKSINPFVAHSDLLQACQYLLTHLPCTIPLQHIKGHQNDGTPTVLLQESWLNIEANLLAKNKIAINYAQNKQSHIPFEPWSLHTQSGKIVKTTKESSDSL